MNLRKIVVVAAVCLSPLTAFAQGSGGAGGNSGDGGAAGNSADDMPLNIRALKFSDLDKDKSGNVDKLEITAAKISDSDVKKMDTNRDGQISQSEFDAYKSMMTSGKADKTK